MKIFWGDKIHLTGCIYIYIYICVCVCVCVCVNIKKISEKSIFMYFLFDNL